MAATLVVWDQCPHCKRALQVVARAGGAGVVIKQALTLPVHARPQFVPFLVVPGVARPLVGTSAVKWVEANIGAAPGGPAARPQRPLTASMVNQTAVIDGVEAIGFEGGPPDMLVDFHSGQAVHKNPYVEADEPITGALQPSTDVHDSKARAMDLDELIAARGYG